MGISLAEFPRRLLPFLRGLLQPYGRMNYSIMMNTTCGRRHRKMVEKPTVGVAMPQIEGLE